MENSKNNSEDFQVENFKKSIFDGMKENLMFSMISYLWNSSFNHSEESSFSEGNKQDIEKNFINSWKDTILSVTQAQLKNINKLLNDENVDMLNIISDKKEILDIEDCQIIINSSIKEIENIFWKICNNPDNND